MAVLRTIDEIIAEIAATDSASDRMLIGIAGAPGAGKSTIASDLVARLDDAALVPMDGYHLPQAELVRIGRRDRMGAADTFDRDGFVAALRSLCAFRKDGLSVSIPGFDRVVEEPVPDAIVIAPSLRKIVVEGNYLLLWDEARDLFDVTFFVRVDRGIRLDRLIERHVRFGKSPEDARAWALGPDENNAQIIEATAARADHVIDIT